jgi:hypothetical protein
VAPAQAAATLVKAVELSVHDTPWARMLQTASNLTKAARVADGNEHRGSG